MTNRVEVYTKRLEIKLADKDEAVWTRLEEGLAVDLADHAAYQNAQSQAFASGKITFDEAQIVYNALGECYNESNGGWSAGTSLACKIAVTEMVGELIGV